MLIIHLKSIKALSKNITVLLLKILLIKLCISSTAFIPMWPFKNSPSQLLYCTCFNFTQA